MTYVDSMNLRIEDMLDRVAAGDVDASSLRLELQKLFAAETRRSFLNGLRAASRPRPQQKRRPRQFRGALQNGKLKRAENVNVVEIVDSE